MVIFVLDFNMVVVCTEQQEAKHIVASGKMAGDKDAAHSLDPTVKSTTVNGTKTRSMAEDCGLGLTARGMMVSGDMEDHMAGVYF